MRQHAIPQNILDVEFKIFTKFTLKEFAYLAIGIGTGGIFLYLYAKNQIPAIIAIPIFIIFSGLGIFFALVPINDQPADQVLKNFISAIRKPTRRVWLDSKMKKNRAQTDAELAKQQVSKNLEEEVKRPKIIGSSKVERPKEVVDDKGLDLLEEKSTEQKVETETPVKKEVKKTFVEQQLTITPQNIANYQFDIEGVEKLPGNINLWMSDKNFKPIPGVVIQLYDKDGNILYANKTPDNGYFLTNKIFPEGVYSLALSSNSHKLPNIKLVIDKSVSKKPIKITEI
jgi:hypothetical protein